MKVLTLTEYRIKHAEHLEKNIKMSDFETHKGFEQEIMNNYLAYLRICGLNHQELIDTAIDYINEFNGANSFFILLCNIMNKYPLSGVNWFPNIGEEIYVYHEEEYKKAKLIAYNGSFIVVEIEGIKELYDKQIWQVQ